MGLLFNLLTLPVSGPLKATIWIAEQVMDVAESQYYDEDAIRRSMQDAEASHEAGEISDDEYEAVIDALLGRLLAAREYRAMKG